MRWSDLFIRKGAFERGRDYAFDQVKKHGKECLARLEIEADNQFDFDDFDRGILDAIREIERKNP